MLVIFTSSSFISIHDINLKSLGISNSISLLLQSLYVLAERNNNVPSHTSTYAQAALNKTKGRKHLLRESPGFLGRCCPPSHLYLGQPGLKRLHGLGLYCDFLLIDKAIVAAMIQNLIFQVSLS